MLRWGEGVLQHTFGEVQGPNLGAAVVDQTWCGIETRHGRDGYDVSFLGLQHAREKFLDQDQVACDVDFEDSVIQFGVGVQDGCAGG